MPLGQLPAIHHSPQSARSSKRKECRGPKTFTSKQKSKQQNLFRKNIEEHFDHKAQYIFSSPAILHKTKTNASFIFATMDPHSRKERQIHPSTMHLPRHQHARQPPRHSGHDRRTTHQWEATPSGGKRGVRSPARRRNVRPRDSTTCHPAIKTD